MRNVRRVPAAFVILFVLLLIALSIDSTAAGKGARGGPGGYVQSQDMRTEPATRRDAGWLADLDAFADGISEKHVDPFRRVSRRAFEADVARLKSAVPRLKDHEILVDLMRIAAGLGDAHTSVGWERFRRYYPIGTTWFREGLFVTAVPADRRELLGARLVRVGDTPVEAARDAVAAVIPHENEAWLLRQSPVALVIPEILDALHVLPDAGEGRFTFRTADGKDVTVGFAPVAMDAPIEFVRAVDPASSTAPLYARKADLAYWFEYLPESQTMYVKFNRCAEMASLPFERFNRDVWAAVDASRPARFVVDLRNNAGGDSSVFRPMLAEIRKRKLGARGQLFAVIGRGTFSSGYLNALELKRDAGAVLVGSPTGQKPNAFGQVRSFRLSNSGVTVQYSTKFFKTVDGDPPSMTPDVRVEATLADVLAGRDPALARICEGT